MAVLLVTYDLRQPGRNYQPVYDYLKRYTYCKGMESVWFLDTTVPPPTVRDHLRTVTDANDIIFVGQITRNWAAFNHVCGDWLNRPERTW